MRVIAGQYRSRPLRSLPGLDLRPTSDRLRETLFDILGAARSLTDSVWLDLYAGTGAVGIEALSRGAREVYFVESAKKHARLLRENLAALGIESRLRTTRARGLEGAAAAGDDRRGLRLLFSRSALPHARHSMSRRWAICRNRGCSSPPA